MTVCGELNKLASNVGLARNFVGGVFAVGLHGTVRLGGSRALVHAHTLGTYNERVSCTVTRFDGTGVTLQNSRED